MNQFLSAAVNVSGSWLTSPLSVLFTNTWAEPQERVLAKVPGETATSPPLIPTHRTVLLQRHRWVLAIALLTSEPRFEDGDTAGAIKGSGRQTLMNLDAPI